MKRRALAIFLGVSMSMASGTGAGLFQVMAAETEEATEETEEASEEDAAEEDAAEEETAEGKVDDFEFGENDLVILFTNDVHGGISNNMNYSGSDKSLGYAGLAAVKSEMQEKVAQVVTVDLGDAIQGSVVTSESDGKDAMDLMEMIEYDFRIPGNHEFDYGMDAFLDYAKNAKSDFLCCNFIDKQTGESVFDGYKVVPYDLNGTELKIGYVGISTPETITKSTPTYFQDEEGNYIYGFNADTPEEFYSCIQEAVDGAIEDGADLVVALGHLGDTGVEKDWSSPAVIENTSGIDVLLDGHAHSEIPAEVVKSKDGEDVLLSSTGTKLENIGVLDISEDGEDLSISSCLINELVPEEIESDSYKKVDEKVQELHKQYEYLFVEVGSTDQDLVIYDPEDTEKRIIRTQETNMGDFLSDAYRVQMGGDIGFLNGGSIRANIAKGKIRYMDLIGVFPWNSEVSLVEVTGQQILDCLEMGARLYPEECGGFIQPSGLSYVIDAATPSSVNVNSDGEFVSVDGDYRVKDVKVGEEPLDLEKTYKLAINKYYSQECGDGMTMFKGSKMLKPAEGEEAIVDHDVIIDYLASLNDVAGEEYADPYGQGRIVIEGQE